MWLHQALTSFLRNCGALFFTTLRQFIEVWEHSFMQSSVIISLHFSQVYVWTQWMEGALVQIQHHDSWYELSIMAGQVRTAIQHELELLCSIMFLTYKSWWASVHNLCPLVHCLSMQRTVVTQNSPLKSLPWQAAEPWMNGWTWASAALPAWRPFLWNSQGKRMQRAIFIPPWLST